jgi:hypothetical protein
MEEFSFVTPVTGLIRPITGKEDDYDDDFKFAELIILPFSNWCESESQTKEGNMGRN